MIKLASPDITEEDILSAVEVIRSGNLIQGKNVSAFEEELASFSAVSCSAVVSSGTAALHLTLKALDISHGDSVIVPAFTFPATANAVINTGADVIFCDVTRESYVATPELIEKTISENRHKNLKGVIVVHEFGYPADINAIKKICEKYTLKLIEDAACALGTVADEHHPGHYTDAACFSFHPRKAITTGEGGAVLSNNREVIEEIKKLRNHGIQFTPQGPDFIEAGLNYRMTDFQAALARGQLSRFGVELAERRKLADLYNKQLSSIDGLHLPRAKEGHSWQSYMVVLDPQIDRNRVVQDMKAQGIETNLGAQALHQLSYFRNRYHFAADAFKTASLLYQSGLVLPLYGKLSPDDIVSISQTLKEVLYGL